MTYTEAAAHNQQFNLSSTFKDPKQRDDGAHLTWATDPNGYIGFIKATRESDGAFLVHYPVRVLRTNFMLTVRCWPKEAMVNFKML